MSTPEMTTTNPDGLPELPPMVDLYARLGGCAWGYTADQMRAYARAALAAPRQEGGDESDEDAHVIMMLGRLLAEIAIIVKGPEPAGTAWSYHDLPEMVRAVTQESKDVADEMQAWANVKMTERGSSRRDKLMVAEWSKRLSGAATVTFPVKDFDVAGTTLTKQEMRAVVRRVMQSPVFAGQDFGRGDSINVLYVHPAEQREPHPDALPDGTLSKSTAKRVTALAAASVSERARELEQAQRLAVSLWERNYKESSPDWKVDETLTGVLLQISNMVSGMSLRSNADNRFADLVVSLRDHAKWGRGGRFTSPHDSKGTSRLLDMAADAIEQALTQQRGHGEAVDRDAWAEALELPEGYTVEEFLPDGWHYAWTRADGERMVSGTTWNHPALAAIAAWQYAPTTTPQPSADAVREDSARLDWIESQIREYGDGYTEPREAGWCIQWQQGRTDHYWPGLRAWIDEERRRASGDELESLLGRDG